MCIYAAVILILITFIFELYFVKMWMHDIKAQVYREIGIAELIGLQKLHPIKQFTTCADVQLATPSLMAFKCAPSGLTERNPGRDLWPCLPFTSTAALLHILPPRTDTRCGQIHATVCDFYCDLWHSLSHRCQWRFTETNRSYLINVCWDGCDGLQCLSTAFFSCPPNLTFY